MASTEQDRPPSPPGSSIASRVKRKRSARRPKVGASLAALFGHHHGVAAAAAAHATPPASSAASVSGSCFVDQMGAGRATSRRRLMVDSKDDGIATGVPSPSSPRARPSLSRSPRARTPPRIDRERQRQIDTIKSKLGRYKHHGTGNPLAVRSPSTPRTLAVDNLAQIIRSGHLGLDRSDLSGSVPKLRTERGNVNSGAFWVNSVELAGHYGWTGLILQPNVDTSTSLPISNVYLFLVEDDEERMHLESLLKDEDSGSRWNKVRDRVVTIEQLANRLLKK